jgi:hypothetical protein
LHLQEPENLLPNPVFRISDQNIPDFWASYLTTNSRGTHINYVVERVNKCKNIFSVLTKHRFGPKITTLITLFKAVVLSRVDYGVIVYGAAAPSNLNAIDISLRRIMRSILGAFKSTPINVLYSGLGIQQVTLRRETIAEKYVIELGHKPRNAAYALAYNLFHDLTSFKKWGVPCLYSFIVSLRERGFNMFTSDVHSMPLFCSSPPWLDPPFEAKFFKISKGTKN